ncbi:MAG: hypothetical protein ACKPKO_09220 [Candidatus Fonsibacter sp.]
MVIPKIGSRSLSGIVWGGVLRTIPENDLEPILGITIEARSILSTCLRSILRSFMLASF